MKKPTLIDVYMAEVKRIPMIDAETERALALAYRAGDRRAGQQLVASHLRLATRIAYKFAPRGQGVEDLVQQANLGLLRALRDFDPDRGARFITYAKAWMLQSIQRYLHQRYAVKLPKGPDAERIVKLFRVHRPRTCAEFVELVELPLEKAHAYWEVLAGPPLSFDLAFDDQGEPLVQRTPGASQPEPDPLLRKRIVRAMQGLDDRERDVIRSRYLVNDPETLQEIGDRYGLSRERIRVIEHTALGVLRKRLAKVYAEAA